LARISDLVIPCVQGLNFRNWTWLTAASDIVIAQSKELLINWVYWSQDVIEMRKKVSAENKLFVLGWILRELKEQFSTIEEKGRATILVQKSEWKEFRAYENLSSRIQGWLLMSWDECKRTVFRCIFKSRMRERSTLMFLCRHSLRLMILHVTSPWGLCWGNGTSGTSWMLTCEVIASGIFVRKSRPTHIKCMCYSRRNSRWPVAQSVMRSFSGQNGYIIASTHVRLSRLCQLS
jgi:hypothetical protein